MKSSKWKVSLLIGLLIISVAFTVGAAGGAEQGPKVVKLTLAGPLPESTPGGIGLNVLAEKLNEYSNGTLQATVYHNGTLGNSTSMVEGVQQGTVDFAVTGNAYYSGLVPEIQVFELPYLFQDRAEVEMVLNSAVADELLAKFEAKGMKGMAFWGIGFRSLTNNIRPVKTPADTKGLKLRTLPAPIQIKLWSLLGAISTPIDSSEVYTSLQQGTVDGQENLLTDIYFNKYYEVQKYMTMTKHTFTPFMLSMSLSTWQKLDADQQAAVLKAVDDATAVTNKEAAELEDEILAELKTLMEVETNPDVRAFKEQSKDSYSVFTEQYGSAYLDKVHAILGR
nr:DctP family TRAP transporter solute-binding subunit [uncultured Sphaerochaeta sp.]